MIFQKKTIFHMLSYKSLGFGALILGIMVIASNKPMGMCYRFYIQSFYHIFPNDHYTKIYRHTNRK